MKVLLRRNIIKLGHIGEVVEVRNGYARNYLLPQGLAMVPTAGNIKAIEAEKAAYLAQVARERAELEARAKLIEGKEVTVVARANEEGHLYGSVGPAQVAAAADREGLVIEAEHIVLDEPIRNLDKYEVTVRFAEGVEAKIGVWVVPPKEEADVSDDDAPGPGEDDDAPGGSADEDADADADADASAD